MISNNNVSAAIILLVFSGSSLALDVQAPVVTNLPVDSELVQTVQTQLPEATAVNKSFLNTDYKPHLTLNQKANVSVTFLDEGAGYKNSLGWITFDQNSFSGLSKSDIDTDNSGVISLSEINAVEGVKTGWLFPNSSEYRSGGDLLAGDTVKVGDGTLDAGTQVSFFLAQNASWGNNAVSDAVLTGDKQMFYGLDFLNPEADHTSTQDSNLANARHVAMLFSDENQDNVIMGFEDLNRVDRTANDYGYRSDEDFNDAVFIVQSDPAEAFGDSNIATAPLPSLGQGMIGLLLLLGFIKLPRSRSNQAAFAKDFSIKGIKAAGKTKRPDKANS